MKTFKVQVRYERVTDYFIKAVTEDDARAGIESMDSEDRESLESIDRHCYWGIEEVTTAEDQSKGGAA